MLTTKEIFGAKSGNGVSEHPNHEWTFSLYPFSFHSPLVPAFRSLSPLFSGLICTAICTVFLCLSALAQEKPDAPKPKPDSKAFWIETAALAASQTADAITTRQLLNRGGWENDPVFGRHPSPAKQAGINAAFFAGQVIAFHYTERSRHAWIRWVGRAAIGFQIGDYVRYAACNAGINPRSLTAQNCPAF